MKCPFQDECPFAFINGSLFPASLSESPVKHKLSTRTPTRKWFVRLLVFGCLIVAAAVWFREPLLRGMADVWIVNEPLEHADAIVILGGGLDTRPFEAAKLYHQGIAPKILLLNVRTNHTDELAITVTQTELSRQVLLKKDVPADAVIVIGDGVASTRDESVAVRKWVDENHPKRIIIPTDPFHAPGVKRLFGKALKGTSTEVRTDAVAARDYTANDWWRHEEGLIAFQNELIKFAYYRLKY